MSNPSSPVPQILREMLKDYPEHIQALQNGLIAVAQAKSVTPAFERAVWELEDALSDFAVKARAELRSAEATGDADAIERARAKALLMGRANSKGRWISDSDLWNYFQENIGGYR